MGGIMKKIILILCVIMTTTVVHATQMCARRNTTVIPLDSVIAPKAGNFYMDTYEWFGWVKFDYGTVFNIGTCLSEPEMEEYAPTWTSEGGIRTAILSTNNEELQGRSGVYVGSDGKEYDRIWCCSQIIHPMSSQWHCFTKNSDAAQCRDRCAKSGYGAEQAMYQPYFRSVIYNSVGVGYTEIDEDEYDESINLN